MKSSMLIIYAVFVIAHRTSADTQAPPRPAKQRPTVTATTDSSVCPDRGTWSQRPATRWEDAMVSGNGRMGVMVFGDPLGEITVQWTDDRGRWSRRTFVSRADNVIAACFTGSGKVNCEFLFPSLNPTAAQGGGGWVAGVSADQIKSRQTIGVDSVTYHNVYTKGKGGFDSAIRVCLDGGKATVGNDGITIQDADEVLLLMRIVPWKTPLPRDRSEAWAYASENPDFAEENLGRYVACPKLADSSVVAFANTGVAETLMPKLKASLERLSTDCDVLFERHVALHRPLFERARLDLGAPPQQRAMSSERLLDEANRSEKMSLALAEKIYDAGRYMFLCCAGELPPNLQGIWTGTWRPAWSGDFTLDTNLELAMKHGFSGNYPELMEGYFRLMESFYSEWRLNAKRTYGADGFLTNARASNTALLLHWGSWPGIFWTSGCGWLVRPFHEHYLYTGDRRFLETRTIPFLEAVAAFYEDFVVIDETTGKIKFI